MINHLINTFFNFLDSSLLFLIITTTLYAIQKMVIAISYLKLKSKLILVCGYVGVSNHELSHLLIAIICGHKIIDVSFFKMDSSGTLGYVEHSYNPRNIYQLIGCFFIGIAPLFGGAATIYLASIALLPEPNALIESLSVSGVNSLTELDWADVVGLLCDFYIALQMQTENVWLFMLWGYLVLSISLFLSPSPADMKNGVVGFIALLTALIFVSPLLEHFNLMIFDDLKRGLNIISSFFLLSALACLAMGLLLVIVSALLSLVQTKLSKANTD